MMRKPSLRNTLFVLALSLTLGLIVALSGQVGIAAANELAAPAAPAGVISLGDYVWYDANFDGQQDPGEEGINGVLVRLYRDYGDGIFDPTTDQLYDSTVTGDDPSTVPVEKGWYEFEDTFLPGNYWVHVPAQPALNGLVFTSETTYAPNPTSVPLPAGAVGRTDIDFGFADPILEVQKTVYIGNDNGASCPGQELVTAAPGETIVYCFQVINTSQDGAVLNYIELDDADLGISETNMTLVPGMGAPPLSGGESAMYAYQTTMQGNLLNTVTATALIVDPDNPIFPLPGLPEPSDQDTAEVELLPEPDITIEKTVYLGDLGVGGCPGSELVRGEQGAVVTYCFVVTNTGNTNLNNVQITDPALAIGSVNDMDGSLGSLPLSPGEKIIYSYSTTIQNDLVNTAAVTATPVDENNVPIPNVDPPTDNDTAQVDRINPAINLQKTVYRGHNSGASCPAGVNKLYGVQGENITYCFKVTNTGDTRLNNVKISDPDLGIDQDDMTAIGALPLNPGQSITYYYQTTLNGDLLNEATATGTPVDNNNTPIPGVTPPTDDDTAEVDQIAPALTVDKTVYLSHDSGASCPSAVEKVIGDQGAAVTYCFKVTNTGDTRLNNITINDPDLNVDQGDMTLIGALPLNPGQSVTYYYETNLDGSLINTATASGTPVDNNNTPIPGVTPPTDQDTAEVEQLTPGIRIRKTVYLGDDNGASCPGADIVAGIPNAEITYCFTVTNAGGTRLDDVEIDDLQLGITQANMAVKSGSLPLEPNQSIVYYYVTNIDGPLENTAVVTAVPVDENGDPIPDLEQPTDEDTAEVEEVEPAIEIQKSVYIGHDGGASCPGQETVTVVLGTDVTYCFEVTNTGNTRLDNVVITDPQLGIDKNDLTKISGTEPLEVGASISFFYQTTANGDLTNVATASATPVDNQENPLPGIPDPVDNDTATVDQVTPAITIEKTVYAGHNNGASCPGGELVQGSNGDQVTYCFTVTNSGDSYLDLVNIDDADLNIVHTDLTVKSGSLPLAPGETIVYYYESAINGNLINTATVEATPTTPDGDLIPNAPQPGDADTAEVQGLGPGIRIDKTVYLGHNNGASCPGGENVVGVLNGPVTYCFVITNTGNTYLDNISIVDPLLGITQNNMVKLSGTTPLAPGAALVYYYQDTIAEALRNTATASADPTDEQGQIIPGLGSPSDADTADVNLQPTATIGDFVWNDLNANGIQDFGEPGIPGVTVQLYDSNGNLVAETTTDANGFYEFTNVDPGQYYIQFIPPNDGYYFTDPYQGNDPGADSDANPTTGRTDFFVVNAGVNDPTRDAGLIQNPTLVLLKTANVAIADAGDSVTYVLSFTNDGPGPALEVVITEIVPANTTFDAANSTPGWTCADGSPAGTVCKFEYGSLAVGASGSVLFSVIIDLKLPEGTNSIYNIAVIEDIPSGEKDEDDVEIPVSPPNAITLESFTATVVDQNGGKAVRVDWVTSAEIDTLGFHIYRSTQTTPETSARVTPSMISGQGNQGGAYSFTDTSVVPGVRYYYWLVETEIGGLENWHGPIGATVNSSGVVANKRVFLPVVTR